MTLLPTPRASDGPKGGPGQTGDGLIPTINALLPTPTSRDHKGESLGSRAGGLDLPTASIDFGRYAEAVTRWEAILGRPAPEPAHGKRLNPGFVEWMMGLPAGWVTEVPGLGRSAQLKALGNGVVPQQALAAITAMITERNP